MESTVVKGLSVLEALARSPGERTLTALAAECGLHKSNVHRLLRTLEECGYARRNPETRTYKATLKLWDLGVGIVPNFDLRAYARPHLQRLAEVTEETAHLSVFDGGEVLYLDKVDGIHPVRITINAGDRAPAYCTSTGKAMLAFLPDEMVRRAASGIEHRTENTVRSLAELKNISNLSASAATRKRRKSIVQECSVIRRRSAALRARLSARLVSQALKSACAHTTSKTRSWPCWRPARRSRSTSASMRKVLCHK